MTREQFVATLALKLYTNEDHAPVVFKDGSTITEDMLCKILDAIKGGEENGQDRH
jgi:hypothetical protein